MQTLRLFACVSLITGCATVTRVEPGPGSQLAVDGRAAVKVVGQHPTISAGTDKRRGEMQAESAGGRFSRGGTVGVFITPASTPSDRYVVEVVNRRRVSIPLTEKNWGSS